MIKSFLNSLRKKFVLGIGQQSRTKKLAELQALEEEIRATQEEISQYQCFLEAVGKMYKEQQPPIGFLQADGSVSPEPTLTCLQ